MRKAAPPEKILVRAPNWIGDAVMCVPALEALKRLYPASGITVLAKKRAAEVFENHPCVASVMEYDDRGKHGGLKGRLALSGELRKMGFAAAVLFQNAFDAAFLAVISGIPERIGYARDLRTPLLTRAVKVTGGIKKAHQVYYYLNIIRELGGQVPKSPRPSLHVSEKERAWAEGFLRERGLAGPLAGASPGASYGPAKMWPPERFAAALSTLSRTHSLTPLVFGGADDRQACAAVKAATPGAVDLCGELTLRQFMAVLERLRVFLTNDSGPMHLAYALGVPTVAVFGSTDETLTGPLGEASRVVKKEIECSPCFKRTCPYGHYRCLAEVDASEVASVAGGLLERGVIGGTHA